MDAGNRWQVIFRCRKNPNLFLLGVERGYDVSCGQSHCRSLIAWHSGWSFLFLSSAGRTAAYECSMAGQNSWPGIWDKAKKYDFEYYQNVL